MRFKKRWKASLKGIIASFFVLLFGIHPFTVFAAVPVQCVIPVSCIGENTSEAFTVVFQMETEDFQKCDTKEISLKNGEHGAFTVAYTYPGTYRYKIWQEKGPDARTTYDATEYTVDVYVTEDEKGVMHAEPVIFINGKDGKCAEAVFTNAKVSVPGKVAKPVNTGDATVIGQYIALIVGSVCVLSFLIFIAKRKKGGE